MTENGVVTLFRVDDESGKLTCRGTLPAWIYRAEGIKSDSLGIYCDNRFSVRIKAELVGDIKAGDYIFFGRAESSCVRIDDCDRIDIAILNGYGLTPHWHLRSEYKTR